MSANTDTGADDLFTGLPLEEPSREAERRIFAHAAIALSRTKRRRNRLVLATVGLAAGVALAGVLFLVDRDVGLFFGRDGAGIVLGKDGEGLFMERRSAGDFVLRGLDVGSSAVAAAGGDPGRSVLAPAARLAVGELRRECETLDDMATRVDDAERRTAIAERLAACLRDLEYLEAHGAPRAMPPLDE